MADIDHDVVIEDLLVLDWAERSVTVKIAKGAALEDVEATLTLLCVPWYAVERITARAREDRSTRTFTADLEDEVSS